MGKVAKAIEAFSTSFTEFTNSIPSGNVAQIRKNLTDVNNKYVSFENAVKHWKDKKRVGLIRKESRRRKKWEAIETTRKKAQEALRTAWAATELIQGLDHEAAQLQNLMIDAGNV